MGTQLVGKLASRRSQYGRSCNKHPTEEEMPRLEELGVGDPSWSLHTACTHHLGGYAWVACPKHIRRVCKGPLKSLSVPLLKTLKGVSPRSTTKGYSDFPFVCSMALGDPS